MPFCNETKRIMDNHADEIGFEKRLEMGDM